MDRRDFLKTAAAFPAAVIATLRTGRASMGDYVFFLHPKNERDLRDLQARERWQFAYLSWRKNGKPELPCQQILDKYTPASSTWEFQAFAEVGRYDNVRFIQLESAS